MLQYLFLFFQILKNRNIQCHIFLITHFTLMVRNCYESFASWYFFAVMLYTDRYGNMKPYWWLVFEWKHNSNDVRFSLCRTCLSLWLENKLHSNFRLCNRCITLNVSSQQYNRRNFFWIELLQMIPRHLDYIDAVFLSNVMVENFWWLTLNTLSLSIKPSQNDL